MKKLFVSILAALILAGSMAGRGEMAIHITDLAGLQNMSLDLTEDYILDNDIDASPTVGWNAGLGFDPVGAPGVGLGFRGSFDGQGYTISDLYINRPGVNVGLFGDVDYSVIIRDVALSNVNIRGGSDAGGFYAGGLSAHFGGLAVNPHGQLINCHVTGSVRGDAVLNSFYSGGLAGWCGQFDVSGCSFEGIVEGANCCGGLFGRAVTVNITESYAVADVTQVAWGFSCGGLVGFVYGNSAITECYSGGSVQGGASDLGGLIGQMRDILGNPSISDCYSTANVSTPGFGTVGGLIGRLRSAPMARCYSTGAVSSGGGTEGGLIGGVTGTATAVNSFWDTETSGLVISAGGTGKTTVEMNTESTFTGAGWDFATIWSICSPPTPAYPWLQWQGVVCAGGVMICLIG